MALLDDMARDHGGEGPAYADVRRVVLLDDGRRSRVVVTMSGALPQRPATSEAFGIGVDLYATSQQLEGDYQLFADGGPDGWFAYLHTPDGFVRYPGTFAVDGRTVVFTVPWDALGGRRSGYFKAFADWTDGSAPGTLGGKAVANDRAPLAGTAAYRR